jgi:hypothetical protein
MLILDASYQSIVLRRNRGSLAADFSSPDTKWMDVRAVEPPSIESLKPYPNISGLSDIPDLPSLSVSTSLDRPGSRRMERGPFPQHKAIHYD